MLSALTLNHIGRENSQRELCLIIGRENSRPGPHARALRVRLYTAYGLGAGSVHVLSWVSVRLRRADCTGARCGVRILQLVFLTRTSYRN